MAELFSEESWWADWFPMAVILGASVLLTESMADINCGGSVRRTSNLSSIRFAVSSWRATPSAFFIIPEWISNLALHVSWSNSVSSGWASAWIPDTSILLANLLRLWVSAKRNLSLNTGFTIFVSTGHWNIGWYLMEIWNLMWAIVLASFIVPGCSWATNW